MTISKIFRAVAVVGALASLCGAASASTPSSTWSQTHQRRAEVNQRLDRQNHRIVRELREGEITAKQAHALHRQDRMVRAEERFMASQRHGHITRAEKRALNQQENAISRKIGL
jgi:hypothetical protein